jgi:uncharacterized RDD family membrane protein YckC
VVLAVAVVLVAPHDRPAAVWFLVAVALTAYETLFTAWLSGTPGKHWLGLRTVELDRCGPPSPTACFRRGLAAGALLALTLPGWILLLCSMVMSPLRRGFDDRAGRTIVVVDGVVGPIRTDRLPGYADAERRPRLIPLGRVGDLEDRRRARVRRLSHAPLLVAAMVALIGAALLPAPTPVVLLVTSAIWLAVFVIDETRLVHRTGTTAGHRQAGLVIRRTSTGGPPSLGRSFWRATVLGFTLYVPVLWPILAISLLRMKYSDAGRALHDLAGGTVVVADPRLDPEEQRQMAMSLRFGTVA